MFNKICLILLNDIVESETTYGANEIIQKRTVFPT